MSFKVARHFSAALRIAISLLCIATSAASARTWIDCTGLNKTEADLVSVADGVVTLRKTDGTTVKLAIDTLSASDITFVHEYIKKAQYTHKAPPDPAFSEIGKQEATVNDFVKKLRDQIEAAVSEDTSVRVSAAQEAVVQSLDAELKRTSLVFRFPIRNVVGNRNYNLSLEPPEGIQGITGYQVNFVATKLSRTDAVKITTNHVMVVRGTGRLISAPELSQLYGTAACLADIYIASTKQYYGIYLENYTWKIESEIHVKPKPLEPGVSAPLARQSGWPEAQPRTEASPASVPTFPGAPRSGPQQTPTDDVNPDDPMYPPNAGEIAGDLNVLLTGGTLEIYLNGLKLNTSDGNSVRKLPLTLHAGNCILFRASSPFSVRALRFAFVDQGGATLFVGTPVTTVIRQVANPNAAVPKQRFKGSPATLGQLGPEGAGQQAPGLPNDAQPIGLPEAHTTYDIAFLVPLVTEPTPASLHPPAALLPKTEPNAPGAPPISESEPPRAPANSIRPSPPAPVQHPMDLRLPSAKYLHSKLTPQMVDQRKARLAQMYGSSYDAWNRRPNIWVGGFISPVFWYSMEHWPSDRQATWLYNYQNVIEPELLVARLQDSSVHDAYFRLTVSHPVINPYFVDPQFTDDPDLMYRDEFVDAVYHDPSIEDEWTMPYSWLVAGIVAGIILLIAWSKHEGYF